MTDMDTKALATDIRRLIANVKMPNVIIVGMNEWAALQRAPGLTLEPGGAMYERRPVYIQDRNGHSVRHVPDDQLHTLAGLKRAGSGMAALKYPVIVSAKGRDGLGWYIVEVDDDDRRSLRHWDRYNIKEAALCEAARKYPGERLTAMFWTGTEWERDR